MSVTSPIIPAECFALLDECGDGRADGGQDRPRSRLYTRHLATLSCDCAAELPLMFEQMQQALRRGQFAVGLFSYELGGQLQGGPQVRAPEALAQVLLFGDLRYLSEAEVGAWLSERSASAPAGIAKVHASVDETEFAAALARIHAYIEAGDTYQVNYTYRLRFDAFGAPLDLYMRLRARQPVPYGALIGLPDGGALLSLSPELFIRHAKGELTARPMKGTAAAATCGSVDEIAAQDAQNAADLAADPKNRAENLMIVDLLRNDFGRIARHGSVRVSAMFAVRRFSSVLQMTSTVCARLREGVSLMQVFAALYPCGSITGAPKRRTMEIIGELESAARGLYTGALGWFDAPAEAERLGDFCLSVPIRTLLLKAAGGNGVRQGEMGVGAGIVHDSATPEEYAECQLKARFLTALPNDFEIFETMHASQEQGCRHLALHLRRLQASALYFGFAHDPAGLREAVEKACAALAPGPHRLRLALKQSGECALQCAAVAPLGEPVRILLSKQPTFAADLFLRHKTSVRAQYDAAWRAAEAQGAFDMLFFNQNGDLTEGGRSNVFVKLDGKWHTPPLASGVLPGIMRAVLLADPAWDAQERRLTLADLQRAEEIVVCNALRGAMPATLG